MINIYLYIFGSVLVVSLVSLIGVITLGLKEERLRSILLHLVAFSAGALLGDVFLHLLPQMSEQGFGAKEGLYFLIGIVIFFALERFVLWHHSHKDHDESVHSVVYLAVLGDSLHNFIDGLVIAVSFLVDVHLGIATAIAVIFHEIPHEIGQFALLLHGGWSRMKATWYNFLSALSSVLGAVVVVLFARNVEAAPSFLLAFAGASFVYIAMADIIPELHMEISWKKSIVQFIWFLFGIGLMAAILLFE